MKKFVYKVECPLRVIHDIFIESDSMLIGNEVLERAIAQAKEEKIYHKIDWDKVIWLPISRGEL